MELVLGSAQFGLDYGVSNSDGIMNAHEISRVLSYAQKIKITKIDTAYAYGNSHKNLAKSDIKKFKIVSKLPSLENININKEYPREIIHETLSDLNLNQIEGFLFHSSNDLLSSKGDYFYRLLNDLKEEGYLKKIGVSIYDPNDIKLLVKNFDLEIIQTPFNVFDRRIVHSDVLNELKKRNIKIQARSIFLQGLLLMNINSLPIYFSSWDEHMQRWDIFNKSNKLNAIESCINFIKNQSLIDEILVGVNNLNQLKEIHSYFTKTNIIQFDDELRNDDLGLIDPRNWKI
tara:strand:+ start:15567 stop:16430 length:864 start_codon:yes stop_codon:yes gene_type:complete